ncbi:hypothetical protein RYA05_03690 [Pseudomonas syringae pv. actinidiae]|nr:hypothetical protein [Pseudomonas syringae pv. actinidiae]
MNTNNEHLDLAISSLSQAIAATDEQIAKIDQSLKVLDRKRRDYLTTLAESLISDITSSVLAGLERNVPSFVTSRVRDEFANSKKFLGLFATKRYYTSLDLLRTRLASHLDQAKYGELSSYNTEAAALSAEKKDLRAKATQTHELIKLLIQAKTQRIELPQPVAEKVTRIVEAARSRRVPQGSKGYSPSYGSSHNRTQFTHTSAPAQDDSFDLYFYLMTDIPTSMRTLLLDAISDDKRQRDIIQQNAPASSTYDDRNDRGDSAHHHNGQDDNGSFQDNSSSSNMGGVATGIVAGGAALAAGAVASEVAPGLFSQDAVPAQDFAPILTDDSLGAYS